jgi:hypothetical protein
MNNEINSDDKNHDSSEHDGQLTRRSVIVGGMTGLVAGILGAKNAVAQGTAPAPPLLQLGGVCEGTLMMLKPADGAAFMQKMLAKSLAFQTLRNHFMTTAGMTFILSRAKVFMWVAPSLDTEAILSPNILGILPSFKPVNSSDPFHEAVGIVVHQNGGAMATSVHVNHNPFQVTEFNSHEVDPDNLTQIITQTISAAQLENLSVQEAANAMGAPKIFPRNIDPKAPTPSEADSTSMYNIALQMILTDAYARPLYPQEGLNSLLAQASLGAKLSSVHFQRYSGVLAKGFYCSCTCCNGCTTTSFTLSLSTAAGTAAE